jgi:hypothetical protein
MIEGTAWMKVIDRHDQLPLMEAVPQPTTETTVRSQKQHTLLRIACLLLTQGTQVPETVVDSSERTTVLRMADFGEKHRGGHLSQRVTETKNESTSHVH